MSRLTELRAAAVALIAGAVPAFKDVTAHVGRYTVDDLKRLHRAAPSCAVGIANVGRPVVRASGEVQVEVQCVAVVVTRAQRVEDADDEALDYGVAIVAALAAWVPAASVAKVQPAANLRMEVVGDDALDNAQMVVWAVIWTHAVALGADQVGAGIDPAHPLAGDPAVTIAHPSRGTVVAGGAA